MKKPESLLLTRACNRMLEKYPKIPYRVDIFADLNLPVHMAKKLHNLHGKWSRGYPDMLICTCRKGFGGLYIELKATDEVADTEHTRTQAQYHAVLRHNGYKVLFVCGYKEFKKAVKRYLKCDSKK